jgi:hypothetical protein
MALRVGRSEKGSPHPPSREPPSARQLGSAARPVSRLMLPGTAPRSAAQSGGRAHPDSYRRKLSSQMATLQAESQEYSVVWSLPSDHR